MAKHYTIVRACIQTQTPADLARWWVWWHLWNHRFGASGLWQPRGSWVCSFVAQFGQESAPSALHTWTHTNKEVSAEWNKHTHTPYSTVQYSTVQATQGLIKIKQVFRRFLKKKHHRTHICRSSQHQPERKQNKSRWANTELQRD